MIPAPKSPSTTNIPAPIREQAEAIVPPFTGHRPVIGTIKPAHARVAYWAIRMQLGDARREHLDDGSTFSPVAT